MVQPVAWPVIPSFHSLSPDDRAADTLPSLVLYCAPSWPLKAILYSSSAFYVPVGPKIHPSTHSYFLLVLLLDNTKLSKDDQVPGFLNLNSLRPSQKVLLQNPKDQRPRWGVNFTEIRWGPDPWPAPCPPPLEFYQRFVIPFKHCHSPRGSVSRCHCVLYPWTFTSTSVILVPAFSPIYFTAVTL